MNELDSDKAGFDQQGRQRLVRPELYMSVIPQCSEVVIEFAGPGEEEILPIAVERRRQTEHSAGLQQYVRVSGQLAGELEMFDHFKTVNAVV